MTRYFNLEKGDVAFAKHKSVFCLVIYDIVSNKRRVKLAHLLSGYGIRVQRSSFELMLTEGEYKSLLQDLRDFYEESEGDSILVYRCKQEDVQFFSPYQTASLEQDCIFL
ncbi:TPA: CRISPR-associated endonuclease Cas2 [Streptococcus suis]|nr:CRISPR-associated endonuclease Cas2 [Streptococcus suis]HEM6419145.1 CRISPR-associated endonuclease Cas2 [Streptococcus suis]HEM6426052.1 CRISPR-associated endonuclease Cas2 [Streptococcus suis]